MHVAQKFEHLLNTYRRSDGNQWTGQQLDEATGGVVTWSYATSLRKGRIESPGYEKMRAIAKTMGFPPEAWFDDGADGGTLATPPYEGSGIAGRVEHLFEVVGNPKTGEPYTNAEAARMTLGDVSEEEIQSIRAGAISDPNVSQIAALAGVFGVEPSYLLDRGEAALDEEIVAALRDRVVREATREISRLSEKERRVVLGIIRQFQDQKAAPSG